MEQFNRFYLWGVNTKYRMGLYFAAAVSFKGLVNALLGLWTVDTLILLEMLLACFAFACLETAIFPHGKNLLAEKKRVALWAMCLKLLQWKPVTVPMWKSSIRTRDILKHPWAEKALCLAALLPLLDWASIFHRM